MGCCCCTPTRVQVAIREDGTYVVSKLWKLSSQLPVYDVEVSKFDSVLDEPLWESTSGQEVSPRQVLNGSVQSSEHMAAIRRADLSYPILVNAKPGEMDVLDGLHRLARAVQLRKSTIRVRFVTSAILQEARELPSVVL